MAAIVLALLATSATSAGCGGGGGGEGGPPICDPACSASAHEDCVAGPSGPECACVAGYEGSPCEWGGGLEDPEFRSPEAWDANAAFVDPDDMGLGFGLAVFPPAAVCGGGTVSQLVTMPPIERADPFVAEVTYRTTNAGSFDVSYARSLRTLRASRQWTTKRFCLGEAAYGGPVSFRFGTTAQFDECAPNPEGLIEVDRFEILVADPGECPPPNAAANGAAERSGSAWFSEVSPATVVRASLEPGAGTDGSDAARLRAVTSGDTIGGAMGTKVSVALPKDGAAPALRFRWKASPDSSFQAMLGRFVSLFTTVDALDTLVGDGSWKTYSYCVPPWLHGGTGDLTFRFLSNATMGESILDVDDVELFQDPACAESIDITDPSFNAAGHRRPGVFLGPADLETPVQVVSDPGLTEGSPGYLEIAYTSNRDTLTITDRFWAPPSSGENGPALVFRSKVRPGSGVELQTRLGFVQFDETLKVVLEGQDWRDNWVCVPPRWTERWLSFRVLVVGKSPPAELLQYEDPQRVLLDDFEPTTLPQCPAE